MKTINNVLLKRIENRVIKEFAKRLNITPLQIVEYNKNPLISDIRYLYCKLRYDMHGATYKDVAVELGRAYSTVWYGVGRINDLLDYNDKNTVEMWNRICNIPE